MDRQTQHNPLPMAYRYIISDQDATASGPIGGKARSLAYLRDLNIPIPPWFVLKPAALEDSLPDGLWQQLQTIHSLENLAKYKELLQTLQPSPAVLEEIRQAIQTLCPDNALVAVRSSAIEEDGATHSYAGQLESYLCIPPDEVPPHVIKVWQSAFNQRIIAYRLKKQISYPIHPPAVLVQRMVFPECSGVAFGADPVSGKRNVTVISAVYGLGSALVSGESDADTFYLDKYGTVYDQRIANKSTTQIYDPDKPVGITTVSVGTETANQPAVDSLQIQQLHFMVRKLGDYFGQPQDVEWAIEKGRIFLLQSRPLTTIQNIPDPDGQPTLWDNRQLLDSFSGITTPLSFSFAQRFYAAYYRHQYQLLSLGIRRQYEVLHDQDTYFERTVGLIRGHVYANITVLGHLSSIMPGARLFETLYHAADTVPKNPSDTLSTPSDKTPTQHDPGHAWQKGLLYAKLFWVHITMSGRIRQFQIRLHDQLIRSNMAMQPVLQKLHLDQLADYLRHVLHLLSIGWAVPAWHDHLTQLFYGALAYLCRTWCAYPDGTLQNDLLCGDGQIASADAFRITETMAALAIEHPTLVHALLNDPVPVAVEKLLAQPELSRWYDIYMQQFGDRCLEDLKLEHPPLFIDPTPFIRHLGHLAQQCMQQVPRKPSDEPSLIIIRQAAEARVRQTLSEKHLQRFVFLWVLRITRQRVRDRENLRLELTRVLGRLRIILREMAGRFRANQWLDQEEDLGYLTLDDILGMIDGTAVCTDLRGLIAVRKNAFQHYRQLPPPDHSFITRGPVHQGNTFQAEPLESAGETDSKEPMMDQRQGQGCCPGIVQGIVRILDASKEPHLEHGEILVAKRSDPGWVIWFPSAAGAVFETGNPLCHTAIVARETGLPTIVGVKDITQWVKTGDRIEINGRTGIVRKLNLPDSEEQVACNAQIV